ncbi:MAG: hydroxymethylglutaryl-CoA synthase [Bacillota bacterium]|uniref:Hydroxymethylglutaryl-CoA synthase n=1 Tax=Virgibacillus salarius TaxID=447199 RepID=A0A941DVN1_9BACI|nr:MULTISPECIES: hydroxymethylglutaryl-CoA synthase [Bacillaceae]NAZ08979.1 hydroxymethylglutaryl-CoA synthase [Agaribacter marinus]MBR7796271.1 hydroxymethylglutaryl-CoA synthase [Virgibacillus salarius]MCC2248503.1 hydroxymethylglutaryl-CoA synthase [Virgibacillus sp. AGTR]MDY7043062.1 hydroxymethylglutaryl-CoA synthase [Virgibacillus sp. M23]QRZ16634.1 hydroxymethylglutaryl-CoA synthase [Virgibacillus sp. AGTR]
MKIGIDKIGFYTPHLYVDMNKLAVARDVEPEKFTIGIGQEKMAVAPITQDSVTMAANAAWNILDDKDKENIDFIIFGTESGIDNSKAAGVYIHELLGLNQHARTIEVKQACYGATAGIQLAKGHIALNPDSKVLVLASDIARYGLNTGGEATQGAGAVAIVVSADPAILALEDKSAYLTSEVMDFWRPVYSDTAMVDGKLSNEKYISFFEEVWEDYKKKSLLTLADFAAICFHLPYTKMGLKALRTIYEEGTTEDKERLLENLEYSKLYNKHVGNIYTGSLYLSFLSLLEQNKGLEAGSRIGLFSYGSGAVGEFFTGIIQPNFREHLLIDQHDHLLSSRKELSVEAYEEVFNNTLPTDGSSLELDITADPANITLAGINKHIRHYVNKTNHK